ncbi:MAG: restriction endonuclease subunit S [Saprospiraceae bacterium]|nr:restriction endonuclease subunit S [Saprospiraceae bacterium]
MIEGVIDKPNQWEIIKIDLIGELLRGITYKKEHSSIAPIKNYLPVLRANNINGVINHEDLVYVDKLYFSDFHFLMKGDILFAMSSGSKNLVGKSAQVKEDFKGGWGAFCAVFRTHNFVDNNLVAYFFQAPSYKTYISNISKGVNINNLKREHITNLNFPLPPLAEQHRIVAKIEELFSSLDKGIEALKTAQQQLKVYRQAVLKYAFEGRLTEEWRRNNSHPVRNKMLISQIEEARNKYYKEQLAEWERAVSMWEKIADKSKKPSKPSKLIEPEPPSVDHENKKWAIPHEWLWTQIGSICFVTKLAGFEYSDYVKYNDNGDLSVLKAENAGPNGFKRTEYSKVYSSSVQMLRRSFLFGGELLVVFVGAGTGNVAAVPNDQKYFLGPNIGMARPYLEINSKYLEYQLQSALGKRMLTATIKAVAQPSLSMGTIRQTPIVFTSLEEQNKIVQEIESRLSVCDKIEENIAQSLQQAEALRQSILKKAFEGKLVPQDPSDEPASVLMEKIKAERAGLNKKKLVK